MKKYIQPTSTEINVSPLRMLAGSGGQKTPSYGNVQGDDNVQYSNRNSIWGSSAWGNSANSVEK